MGMREQTVAVLAKLHDISGSDTHLRNAHEEPPRSPEDSDR
jgi:hypothetical protein